MVLRSTNWYPNWGPKLLENAKTGGLLGSNSPFRNRLGLNASERDFGRSPFLTDRFCLKQILFFGWPPRGPIGKQRALSKPVGSVVNPWGLVDEA